MYVEQSLLNAAPGKAGGISSHMSVTASVTLGAKERVVQEALEAKLEPSELLLGFTQGRHNPGDFFAQSYCVGLTQRRILFVNKENPLRTFSIYRPFLKRVSYVGQPLWRGRSGLKLEFGAETLHLATSGLWNARAGHVANEYNRIADAPVALTAVQVLAQVNDLLDLGLVRAAEDILQDHVTNDPLVEIEPDAFNLGRVIGNARLALKLGAVTFGMVLIFMLGMVFWGLAKVGLGMFLALGGTGALLIGRQHSRGLALTLALLLSGLNLMISLFAGSGLDSFMWIAFAVAMLLLLTGRPTRGHLVTAVAIFILGFWGMLALGALFGQSPAAPGTLNSFDSTFSFQDSFSVNHGWASNNGEDLVSQVADGFYSVHIKKPASTFFTFPPVRFHPNAVEFGVHVPGAFAQAVGTYGAACDFSGSHAISQAPGQAVYLIEIAPAEQQYAILKKTGESSASLLSPTWQPIKSSFAAGSSAAANTLPVERVSVRCQKGEIELLVNGVEQVHTQVVTGPLPQTGASMLIGAAGSNTVIPDMLGAFFNRAQPAGYAPNGRVGLLVSTWKDTGPGGFQVLFDDAYFWVEN